MTKKPKKAKTPKAAKGRGGSVGGGKDPITGITLDLQGIGEIQSDKIYDSSSGQVKSILRLIGAPFSDDLRLELEYNSNAIILNSITRRSGATTGENGTSDYYNRNIFLGKFLPTNGGERSFQVDSYYRGGFYPWDTWDDASQQRMPSTYEHVTRIDAAGFALSSNIFKSYSGFPRSERVLFSTEQVTDYEDGWTSSQSRNAIPGEVAQFFQTGWHNPEIFFSSNLI
jgi:hypothetical protein